MILLACNTAAGGAEALSGVARAFFYAGARVLLVSHWAVHSDATGKLVTRAASEMASGVGRAEAMRRGDGDPDCDRRARGAPSLLGTIRGRGRSRDGNRAIALSFARFNGPIQHLGSSLRVPRDWRTQQKQLD